MSGAQWWEGSGRDARAMQPADNYIAGVHGPFPTAGGGAGGGGPATTVTIAGPLPLPVEVVPPEPIEFLEIIEHVEGAVWAAWPANVVSWSVTCEVGTVVLTGVTAAGGDTTLHAVDDVGAGISSEEFHTVDHPTSVDATAGRALITILYRP